MLIGICGAAGSGKDTLAGLLVEKDNFQVRRMADPIKKMLEAGFGIALSDWEDRHLKDNAVLPHLGVTRRYLAQTLGTEWGREKVHDNVWVILAEQWVKRNRFRNLAIPDVRFDNEVAMIRRHDGVVIKIVRPNRGHVDNADHASEAGIPDSSVDAIIHNDGSISDLHRKVWRAVYESESRG